MLACNILNTNFPIAEVLPEILSALHTGSRLVLEAHGEALWLKVSALQRSSRV